MKMEAFNRINHSAINGRTLKVFILPGLEIIAVDLNRRKVGTVREIVVVKFLGRVPQLLS
jgi:hypothetical protein